jgi:hypothetical protein
VKEAEMNGQELDQCLGELFAIFNDEARLLGPTFLESNMDATFRRYGVEWFLDNAQQLNIAEATYVRRNVPAVLSRLKSEQGKEELKRYVEENRDKFKQCRRKLAQLTRLSGIGEQGTEFEVDHLPDNGGVYRILMGKADGSTEGGNDNA